MGRNHHTQGDGSVDPRAGLPQVVLRYRDQVASATVLLVCVLLLIGQWFFFGGHRGHLIEIEEAEPRLVEFQIDINTAAWPEFTMLPGIGETTAKRIVAYRDANGPFTSHGNLLRIEGIGERTLGRLGRYLLPIATDAPAPLNFAPTPK